MSANTSEINQRISEAQRRIEAARQLEAERLAEQQHPQVMIQQAQSEIAQLERAKLDDEFNARLDAHRAVVTQYNQLVQEGIDCLNDAEQIAQQAREKFGAAMRLGNHLNSAQADLAKLMYYITGPAQRQAYDAEVQKYSYLPENDYVVMQAAQQAAGRVSAYYRQRLPQVPMLYDTLKQWVERAGPDGWQRQMRRGLVMTQSGDTAEPNIDAMLLNMPHYRP